MIKGSIQEENITIMNTHTHTHTHTYQHRSTSVNKANAMVQIKGYIDSNTIIMGGL